MQGGILQSAKYRKITAKLGLGFLAFLACGDLEIFTLPGPGGGFWVRKRAFFPSFPSFLATFGPFSLISCPKNGWKLLKLQYFLIKGAIFMDFGPFARPEQLFIVPSSTFGLKVESCSESQFLRQSDPKVSYFCQYFSFSVGKKGFHMVKWLARITKNMFLLGFGMPRVVLVSFTDDHKITAKYRKIPQNYRKIPQNRKIDLTAKFPPLINSNRNDNRNSDRSSNSSNDCARNTNTET